MHKEHTLNSIEIDSSVLNLFDKSILYTTSWPVEALVNTLQESGYRGLEWLPLRGVLAGMQMNMGLVSQLAKDAVVSLHQSYRNEKNLRQSWAHHNRPLALMSYALLPERVDSLSSLERLQKVLGKELPVVLYPSEPDEESGTDRPFAAKTFQPTPQIMQKWNVRTIPELIQSAKQRGYTGFCLDLFLLRAQRVSGFNLDPWQETLPQLLPFTQEIHVAAGRLDIKQDEVDTMQELQDLLQGQGSSDILPMLKLIREEKWQGQIVTEIPAIALHKLRRSETKFTSVKSLIDDHKEIIDTIQTQVA